MFGEETGTSQERMAYSLLTSVFGGHIAYSPKEYLVDKEEEIIDVLCWYDKGIFLVESKSLSNFNPNQSQDRQRKNLKYHIEKAVRQIVGASRRVRSDTSPAIKALNIDADAYRYPLQALVVIMDHHIFANGDWSDTVDILESAIKRNNIILNVVDLNTLSQLVHMSGYLSKKGGRRLEHFDALLIVRCKLFLETRNLYFNLTLPSDE